MSLKKWYSRNVTLEPNQQTTINLDVDTNVVQVINRRVTGGTEIFIGDKSPVNPQEHEGIVDKGMTGAIVRPYPLRDIHLFNPSGNKIVVEVVEIITDDLSYIFNASSTIQVQGQITSDALKPSHLNLEPNGTLNVKVTNDRFAEVINLLTQIEINTRP